MGIIRAHKPRNPSKILAVNLNIFFSAIKKCLPKNLGLNFHFLAFFLVGLVTDLHLSINLNRQINFISMILSRQGLPESNK